MPAPMTAFTVSDTTAPFQIVHEGEWLPLWEQATYSNVVHVPGSSSSVTFLLGTGPLTATWTVECDDADDYALLIGLLQSEGTLRMPTVVAERMGTEADLFGQIYTEISNVVLMQIAQPQIALGGVIQCDVTFMREDRS